MEIGKVTMRTLVIATLIAALGGCYSIRHRNDNPDAVAAGDAAPAKAPKQKASKEILPTGLAGDKEHHAYTDRPN